MEDLEEDALMRNKINIYKDTGKMRNSDSITVGGDDDNLPDAPTLAEMLEELDMNDVEMNE